MEMFQSRQRQILDRQTVGAQFAQKAHFGQMFVQFRRLLSGRWRPQPFQPGLLATRNRFQQLSRPGIPLCFVRRGTDGIDQDRFLVA